MKPEAIDQIMVIRVTGEPKAQPRAKATTVNGRARMYTPNHQPKDPRRWSPGRWKSEIRGAAVDQMVLSHWVQVPSGIPVFVWTELHFRRPSGYRKAVQFKYTKPDKDNLEKAVLDSLTKVGVFADDNQVVGGPVWKLIDDNWQGGIILVCTGEYILEQFKPIQEIESEGGRAMIERRLTRNEAIVTIWDALKGTEIPLPDEYPGGWMQIMEDALCLGKGTIRCSLIPRTRRDSPLFTQKRKGGQQKMIQSVK